MPKPKKNQKKVSDFLNTYDAKALIGALGSFENSLGWDLFKSFLYYQAANHAGMSVIFAQQTGKQYEACASGAKAEVLRNVVDDFIIQLKNKVVGNEGVIENVRPLEEVVNE